MDKNNKAEKSMLFASVALIVGNLIGAGILGLPVETGLAGLLPSIIGLITAGAVMGITAVILGNQACKQRSKTFDYPSLYEKLLGKAGKWVAVGANLIILYGLLTAYFTGGADVIAGIAGEYIHKDIILLFFAAVLIAVTCSKLSLIHKLNIIFIFVLFICFAFILAIAFGNIEVSNMRYSNWFFMPATLPIIITSFHFHNIIPVITANLKWDKKKFRKSVYWGIIIALVLNTLWIFTAIGVLPLTGENSLLNAWTNNLPATVPMEKLFNNIYFQVLASLFALTAICSSFFANGLGLQSFITDLLNNTFKKQNRLLVIILTFLPPLFISYIYPDIFLKALEVVGGIGIVTLFIILPCYVVLKDRSQNKYLHMLYSAALFVGIIILIIEILQQCRLIVLTP
jgi:tyrosine-specific transport protein